MSIVLNIAGILLVIGGTILGATLASSSRVNPIFGIIGGFVISFLFVVVAFGTAFLILEINNNLVRIARLLKNAGTDQPDDEDEHLTRQAEARNKAMLEAKKQAVKESLRPDERMCNNCGAKYKPGDYNKDAPSWTCSTCKQQIPKE